MSNKANAPHTPTSGYSPARIRKKLACAVVASLLFCARGYAAPPLIITTEANYQQTQDLPDMSLQQGSSATLQFRLTTKTGYQDLTGMTCRWEGRSNAVSTQALQVASSLTYTTEYPHYFVCELDSTETGTSVTNWVWSLIVVDGGDDYVMGVGELDIVASGWTGAAAILTNATSKAYTDAAIATHTAISDAHHTRYTDAEAVAAGVAAGFVTSAVPVAVSGGLLTSITANGTNTIGLTTGAVNNAESDPNAVLADGSRAMTGNLNMGTQIIRGSSNQARIDVDNGWLTLGSTVILSWLDLVLQNVGGNTTLDWQNQRLSNSAWEHPHVPTTDDHIVNKAYADANTYTGIRQDLSTSTNVTWLPTKYSAKWSPSASATFAMSTNTTYPRTTYALWVYSVVSVL